MASATTKAFQRVTLYILMELFQCSIYYVVDNYK